jgi:hypothetical protein
MWRGLRFGASARRTSRTASRLSAERNEFVRIFIERNANDAAQLFYDTVR